MKETKKTVEVTDPEAISESTAPSEEPKPIPRVKKVYGIHGYMEIKLRMPTGYEALPVIYLSFEGGHITGFGVSPASLTTDDPVLQKIIESSWYYKKKKIRLIKELPLE